MEYEDVLKEIGDFGKFQRRQLAIVFLPVLFASFSGPISVFLAGDQNYRCRYQSSMNDTNSTYASEESNGSTHVIVHERDQNNQCLTFSSNGSREACEDWDFDTSVFENTIVSQFDLVCENKLLKSHAVAAFFIGSSCSVVIMTCLADMFGRRVIACISLTIMFIANVVMPFSTSIHMVTVTRFMDGFFGSGVYMTTFVIALELMSASKRIIAGTVILLVYCAGQFILVFLAYFIRDWRWLQLTVGIPMIIPLVYWWFVVSFIYYGITLNLDKLGGNIYASFAFSTLAETLGCIPLFFMDKVGHKRLHMAAMGSTCIVCIASIFSILFAGHSEQWLSVLFAMIGKCSVSAAFGMVYVYTGEIFPTVTRTFAVGSCNFFARVASLCSPYLYDIAQGTFKNVLPLILYAVLITIVTLLAALLPETTKKTLPDKIKDTEEINMTESNDAAVPTEDPDEHDETGKL